VLLLFGVIPAAMSWSDRNSKSSSAVKIPELVPGGRITLLMVLGSSGYVILSELFENLQHL
jgi:tyrosine-specific transport protein